VSAPTSSTEGAVAQAQRFDAVEAGTSAPSLTVTYACRGGFDAAGAQATGLLAQAPCQVAA